MALVFIIVVAWLVILGPSLIKRRSRTAGGINSISHFHRQLRILEHSGPDPIVTPAFRLRSVDGSVVPGSGPKGRTADSASAVTVAPKLSVVGADRLPRPALAFLGHDPAGAATDPVGRVGDGAGRSSDDGLYDPAPCAGRTPARPPQADGRALVRRRRRDTLVILAGVVSTTFLLGLIPGARPAWIVTLLSALALAAYVVMLVRMRKLAEERDQKLRHLRPRATLSYDAPFYDADAVPYDGTFDDELALPSGVTGLPVRVSGRYAHPSYQAAAAH